MKIRIAGKGRAGRSLALALTDKGHLVELFAARALLLDGSAAVLAHGADAVVLAVADRYVAELARAIEPDEEAVLLHLSGALGLGALREGLGGEHRRTASCHPLSTLPEPVVGSVRLQGGAYFAVAGDALAARLAESLGGNIVTVDDDMRVAYHAAACIAANHLVALLGQVERVASSVGLPLEAFLPLAAGALEDVIMLGPAEALTGPAARGDEQTMAAHRQALDPAELPGYDAGVALAKRLSTKRRPAPTGAPELSWS